MDARLDPLTRKQPSLWSKVMRVRDKADFRKKQYRRFVAGVPLVACNRRYCNRRYCNGRTEPEGKLWDQISRQIFGKLPQALHDAKLMCSVLESVTKAVKEASDFVQLGSFE